MLPAIRYSPYDSTNGMSYRKQCVKSTSKSLNTLRQLLQKSFNEEIDDVMQKYIKLYLEPAVDNIENNQRIEVIPGLGMPARQHIKVICRQMLDDAKKMY